ncbi:Uncharacterised protein [Neisseria meningitidis]|nr:Uncharacterised protein [Neisseria meningitidis]
MADAEREQEAREFGRFAGFYAPEDVFRPLDRLFFMFARRADRTAFRRRLIRFGNGFVRRFFHFLQGRNIEAVEVGEVADEVLGDKLFDLFFTQAVDVHGFARGEVD